MMWSLLKKRVGRGLLFGMTVVILVLAIGVIYQEQATAQDRLRYSPPGSMIEVNGRAMHIHCIGEGSPTCRLFRAQD